MNTITKENTLNLKVLMYKNAVDKTICISVRDPNQSKFWIQSADGNWLDTKRDNRAFISLGHVKTKNQGRRVKKKLYEAYTMMGWTRIQFKPLEVA